MKHLLIAFGLLFQTVFLNAQCEGCIVNPDCSADPAAPSLCPSELPNAIQGEDYEIDLTFFMPNQFDDEGSGVTVTLSQITIISVSGLPNGVSWTTNEADNIYDITSDLATQRGCVRMCGVPEAIGSYTISVNILASITSPISTEVAQSFTLPLLVNPGGGGNSGFAFSPSSGCDSLNVSFEALISSETQPVTYSWDFGNGNFSTEALPPAQEYLVPDTYYVNLQTDLLEFVLTEVAFTATGTNWCGDIEEPSIPIIGTCTGSPDIYFIYTVGSSSQQSATVDNNLNFLASNLDYVINQPSFSLAFFDEDFFTADDNLGSTVIQVSDPGTFNFNTSEGFGTYTIGTRVSLSFENQDTVIVFAPPSIPELTVSDSLICSGDSITIASQGGFFYQWLSMGVPILSANDSSLVIYDSDVISLEVRNEQGCLAVSDSIQLTVANTPESASVFYNPITETLIYNPGFEIDWVWLLDGIEIADSENITNLNPSSPGDYSVLAVNEFGCGVISDSYSWTNVGIEKASDGFKIYPNPSYGGSVFVEGISEPGKAVISDLYGKTVFEQELNPGFRKELQIGKLAQGIYSLTIITNNQAVSKRLIIRSH